METTIVRGKLTEGNLKPLTPMWFKTVSYHASLTL
uniref:Uncharacterized protein n=1 Tax=Anguilla anguilla TaxID=7936 RepID=A0A0E9VIA4_ANGAN